MNSDSPDFVSLKNVKLEDNTNDYYNINDYLIEDKPSMNLVPKVEIKCKNKCFDIVDKWIARVVVEVPTGNNWHNIVAREIALLKVRYPFLTEQQLRGKALTKFGIPSMCGNLVRTGAGKVTKAIAIELSRTNNKTKRIPAAFKVLNSFLPCMKKFDEKPATNMWVRENHQISTLYNRKTTNCRKNTVRIKTIVKPEIMENYWKPSHRLLINPMNKWGSSYSSSHTRINKASEEIDCSVLTPKKKHPPIPARKALLSKFNETDMTIVNGNEMIVPKRRKIKQEVASPDSKECLRIIANDFKENLRFDDSDNEILDKKRRKREMRTYTQLSQESKDILAQLQRGTENQELLVSEEGDYWKQTGIRSTNNPSINFRGKDVNITQFEWDNCNFSHRKQLYSESSLGRYESKSFIPSYKRESSFSFASVSGYSPSSSQQHTSSQNIKRRYGESINSLSSPRKIVKHNDNHNFQDILPNNSSYDQVHQFFSTQTMFIKSFDESMQSETQCGRYSELNTANISYEATPSSEKLNSLDENENASRISVARQYLAPFHFESLSISSAPYSFSSRPDGSLKYLQDEIGSQNFNCESLTDLIESETMCTMPSEPAGLSSTRNSPCPSPPEVIMEDMSPDLLDRNNITQLPFPHDNSGWHVNTRLDFINCSTRSLIKRHMPKSFMLSDFCSEYDSCQKILRCEATNFITIKDVSVHQYIPVPIASIREGIENAMRILNRDIDNFAE